MLHNLRTQQRLMNSRPNSVPVFPPNRIVSRMKLARTANPKATIGLSLYVATGTGPTVDYFLNIFAAGCFTNLAGPAGQVAAGIQGFGQLGVDRITVLPPTAESAAELAPHLFDR